MNENGSNDVEAPAVDAVYEGADGAAGASDDTVSSVANSVALGVAGNTVNVTGSMVGAVAASDMRADNSLFLFGAVGELSGDASVLVDAKAAIMGAAVFAVVLGVMGALFGRRR